MNSKFSTFDVTEDTLGLRGWMMLENLLQDLRFAARMLRKNIGFTLLSVLVLALGIGANAVIFSVVNAALLQPLPYSDADRIVQVWHTPPQKIFRGFKRFAVSIANFLDWENQQHVFEHIAMYHFTSLNLTSTDQPESIPGVEVTEDFFSVLGIQPLLGRVFMPEEMKPGHNHVVVLSHAAWQSYFGSDRGIVGRTVTFDGNGYTVVGVMPKRFRFPGFARIWVPAAWTAKDRANRSNHNSLVIARLKPGINLGQARAEMDTISRRLEQIYPAEDAGWGAVPVPLREQMAGNLRTPLLVLLGAVGCVLFIACSNVANLILAKTLGRSKEIAIRSALGATRGRLLQLVLGETLMLAVAGGGLGLVLARYGVRLIIAFFGNRLPPSIEVHLDGSVLAFTFAVSVSCGILAGVLPAIRLIRSDVNLQNSLKQGLGYAYPDSGGVRTRNVLVIAEVSLSMILLVGAGLLIRTLWVLRGIEPGFDPHNVLTMQIPRVPLRPDPKHSIFVQQVLERVRRIPGIASVGATSNVPLSGNGDNWPIQIEGQPPQPMAQQPNVAADVVTPGYFAALRIPILGGRDFSDADAAEHPPVVVISESMAKGFWPNQDPVGKRLSTSVLPEKLLEVVGVVGDVRSRGLERAEPVPTLYVPSAQFPHPRMSLVLRLNGSTAGVAAAVTRAVHEVDQQQPVQALSTMEEIIATSFSERRFNMLLLVAFAGLALILTAAGIYGVLSYTVRRRTREIGIRMALGAQIADVLRKILMDGMRPTLIGVVLGIVGSLFLGRIASTMIYGVKPTDLRTFAAVVALLAAISFLACIIPAYRATQVQPLTVLRDE